MRCVITWNTAPGQLSNQPSESNILFDYTVYTLYSVLFCIFYTLFILYVGIAYPVVIRMCLMFKCFTGVHSESINGLFILFRCVRLCARVLKLFPGSLCAWLRARDTSIIIHYYILHFTYSFEIIVIEIANKINTSSSVRF